MIKASARSDSAKPANAKPKRKAQRPLPPVPSDFAGIRVLCVDDHAVLIEGLRAQFAIDDRIRIVGSLETAGSLLEETTRLNPDVILLDIEMPGPDVFEMADRLRHAHPRVRFVFLSAHIRDGYLAAAYKCGAWGYFAKGDHLEDIVAGVGKVATSAEGTFVMGPKVRARCQLSRTGRATSAPRTRTDENAEPMTGLSSLSPREIAVLRLIGKGLSRTEIASELSRSVKTVDGHQERMMKKLHIASRTELMRLAIREGFAEA